MKSTEVIPSQQGHKKGGFQKRNGYSMDAPGKQVNCIMGMGMFCHLLSVVMLSVVPQDLESRSSLWDPAPRLILIGE